MRLYPFLFKQLFRRMDPETAHELAFAFIRGCGLARKPLRNLFQPSKGLRVNVLGLTFPSPFGLAAGFDKNARGIEGLEALGFGHVEVGTLTPRGQTGNPRPRLFRLIDDRAIINRMGFNNDGSLAALPRLVRARNRRKSTIIGVNIGKNRDTDVDVAVEDYVSGATRLAGVADYLAVNVSSPNTPGLRGLQELAELEPILKGVLRVSGSTPVLVKIAPDMDDEQIIGIVETVERLGLAGIIATNTTIERAGLHEPPERVTEIGAGGLSGRPLKERSLEVLRVIRANASPSMCVISVGGVETADDVIDRLDAGADLVQGFSAFIYEGPLWAHRINVELKQRGWRASA